MTDIIVDLSATYFGWQDARRGLGLGVGSLDFRRLIKLVANEDHVNRITGLSAAVQGQAQKRFHNTLERSGWDLWVFDTEEDSKDWPIEMAYLMGQSRTDRLVVISAGSHLDNVLAHLTGGVEFAFFRDEITPALAQKIVQQTVQFVDLTPHVPGLTLRANAT